jgi:hypothetical protein
MEKKPFNKNRKYVNLGVIMSGKDGGSYIAIDSKVELVINGTKFTGKYISLNSPADKFARMLQKGSITEQEYEDKVAKIPEFIKKDVVVALE